jgi:hypothetical protein
MYLAARLPDSGPVAAFCARLVPLTNSMLK